ncbi:MAG: pilus assembly PilX N-terminal domain-containing protein [Candidatus Pacebacteria bacterium]|nr:pilus assembly PilX N-terminal domain-containing protein [Candidatus Paceibacterota bacterium]
MEKEQSFFSLLSTFNFQHFNNGFVSVLAILLANVFLILGLSVFNIASRELTLSSGARESLFAFYAADGGMECALYWDIKQSGTFATSSEEAIESLNCNKQDASIIFSDLGGGNGKSEFELNFAPDSPSKPVEFYPCVQVEVFKRATTTSIRSYGRNTCDIDNARRVERAWEVTY